MKNNAQLLILLISGVLIIGCSIATPKTKSEPPKSKSNFMERTEMPMITDEPAYVW